MKVWLRNWRQVEGGDVEFYVGVYFTKKEAVAGKDRFFTVTESDVTPRLKPAEVARRDLRFVKS